MAPTLPINADQPDRGSDEETWHPSGNFPLDLGPSPGIIHVSSDSSDNDSPSPVIANDEHGSDSDREMPIHSHEGYVPLIQDLDQVTFVPDNSCTEEQDEETIHQICTSIAENGEAVPNTGISETSPVNEVPVFETKDTMDEAHIEKIKNVMRSVQLPPSNLPAWTEAIPEAEWKSVLLKKLNLPSNSKSDSPNSEAGSDDIDDDDAEKIR